MRYKDIVDFADKCKFHGSEIVKLLALASHSKKNAVRKNKVLRTDVIYALPLSNQELHVC